MYTQQYNLSVGRLFINASIVRNNVILTEGIKVGYIRTANVSSYLRSELLYVLSQLKNPFSILPENNLIFSSAVNVLVNTHKPLLTGTVCHATIASFILFFPMCTLTMSSQCITEMSTRGAKYFMPSFLHYTLSRVVMRVDLPYGGTKPGINGVTNMVSSYSSPYHYIHSFSDTQFIKSIVTSVPMFVSLSSDDNVSKISEHIKMFSRPFLNCTHDSESMCSLVSLFFQGFNIFVYGDKINLVSVRYSDDVSSNLGIHKFRNYGQMYNIQYSAVESISSDALQTCIIAILSIFRPQFFVSDITFKPGALIGGNVKMPGDLVFDTESVIIIEALRGWITIKVDDDNSNCAYSGMDDLHSTIQTNGANYQDYKSSADLSNTESQPFVRGFIPNKKTRRTVNIAGSNIKNNVNNASNTRSSTTRVFSTIVGRDVPCCSYRAVNPLTFYVCQEKGTVLISINGVQYKDII